MAPQKSVMTDIVEQTPFIPCDEPIYYDVSQ